MAVAGADREQNLGRKKVLYAWGGSSGIGEMGASRFSQRGGEVVVFSSQQVEEDGQMILPSVTRAIARMKRRGVDPNSIKGVYTNQKILPTIEAGIQQVRATPPDNSISASAGGVDTFAEEFREDLLTLRDLEEEGGSKKDEKVKEKIREIKDKAENLWVPAARQDALAINHTGQVATFEALTSEFPDKDFDFLYLNSIFGHTGLGPPHYRAVAETKRKTTEWIQQHAPAFAERKKYLGELVLPAVERTGVGTLILELMMPFYPEKLQEAILDTTVSKEDAATAMEVFWDMSPKERAKGPHPYTLFATRHKGELVISQEMPQALRNIDVSLFPF